MKEIITDSKFEYIEEIEPFFWWTGSLNIKQAITHLTKRYDEEEAHPKTSGLRWYSRIFR